MQFKIDSKKLGQDLRGRFGKYQFEVGVLEDGPHFEAKRGARGKKGQDVLKSYAGGPARKVSTRQSGQTIAEVSAENSKRLGFNYLAEPFQKKNSDIVRFMAAFLNLAFGKSEKKRAENLLQAVVRNPILRGDYGSNSALTQKIKGFDRLMIDTSQLFKSIRARCTIRTKT